LPWLSQIFENTITSDDQPGDPLLNANIRRAEKIVSEVHPGITERIVDLGQVRLNCAEGPPTVRHFSYARTGPSLASVSAADPGVKHALAHYCARLRGQRQIQHIPRGYRGTQYADDIMESSSRKGFAAARDLRTLAGGHGWMWLASHNPELCAL